MGTPRTVSNMVCQCGGKACHQVLTFTFHKLKIGNYHGHIKG